VATDADLLRREDDAFSAIVGAGSPLVTGRELNASVPVRVLDISRSGVSIGSKTELAVGDRGELRAAVGTESLSVVTSGS